MQPGVFKERLAQKRGQQKNRINYYPFGLSFNSYKRENSVANRYLYNGKELQEETGWLDYGARMYQPELGRFFTQDRYAEKYYSNNPYHYVLNNPINAIDINGDSTFLIGWNNAVNQFNSNFQSAVAARANDPSILLDDLNEAAGNLLQTAADFTINLFGENNETRNAVGAAVETVSNISEMSEEEVGALAATTTIVVMETIAQKKVPLKGASKGSLTGTKGALTKAKAEIGLKPTESLAKGKSGKFGSPQRGDAKKGYRLDPAHPNAKPGSGEEFPHVNYWDYTKGKRGKGGVSGAMPITQ